MGMGSFSFKHGNIKNSLSEAHPGESSVQDCTPPQFTAAKEVPASEEKRKSSKFMPKTSNLPGVQDVIVEEETKEPQQPTQQPKQGVSKWGKVGGMMKMQ